MGLDVRPCGPGLSGAAAPLDAWDDAPLLRLAAPVLCVAWEAAMFARVVFAGADPSLSAPSSQAALFVLMAVGCAALFLRYRLPVVSVLFESVVGLLASVMGALAYVYFLPLVALYACVARAPRREAAAGGVAAVATVALSAVVDGFAGASASPSPSLAMSLAGIGYPLMLVLGAALLSRFRLQRLREAEAAARAEAERDRALAKSRIAAELHDSVGHDLTAIVALSEGLAGATGDEQLDRAIASIHELARSGLAVTRREHSVHVGETRPAVAYEALVRGVVDVLVLGLRRDGPLDGRIPDADIRVRALRQATLAGPHAKDTGGVLAHEATELRGAKLIFERRRDQRGPVLDARAAVGDGAEVIHAAILLPMEVEAAVIRGDGVDLAVEKGLAESRAVGRLARRRTHNELETLEAVLSPTREACVIKQQVLRASLDEDVLLAARFGSANSLEAKLRGEVYHVHARISREVGEVEQTAHRLGLALGGTAQRMAFRSVNASLVHALLESVDEGTILAVDAERAAKRFQGLEHLKGLRVIKAQVIIGEVGLEGADAASAHRGEVLAVALVPLRDRHMEGIV